MSGQLSELVDQYGFAIVPDVLDADQIARLQQTILKRSAGNRERYLLEFPELVDLARSRSIRELTAQVCGVECHAIAATLFDKFPGDNWFVPRHQDVNIAVKDRHDVAGFGAWSIKHGVVHVQPPEEVLEQVLAVRLHLDAADGSNGALRVLPGSHRYGRLDDTRLSEISKQNDEVLLEVGAGAAILMRAVVGACFCEVGKC